MQSGYRPEVPCGFFQIADLSSAVSVATAWTAAQVANGITKAPDAAQFVLLIDAEVAAIRWRAGPNANGVTAAIGSRIPADGQLVYTAGSLENLWLIAESAGAKANISIFQQTN